jgi:tetratricopeptide (TPR) repeat protein
MRVVVDRELPWYLRERVRVLIGQCIVEDREYGLARERLLQLDAEDALTPYGLRMLAAVRLFGGDPAAARELLERAIARRAVDEDDDLHDRRTEQLMLAETLVVLDRPTAALAVLDGLITEDGPGPARLAARGAALARLGDREAAAEAYRASVVTAEPWDAAWLRLELAALLEPDAARAVLEASSDEHTADGELALALARLHAAAGRTDAALAALARAVAHAREPEAIRIRAAADPPLAALPGFAAAIAAPVADTAWLDAHPALAALRDAPELRAIGVRFVDQATGQDGGDALREHYAGGDGGLHLGTIWTDSLWLECQRVAAPLTLIAQGPEIPGARHMGELTHLVQLYVDLAAPDQIWIAPSREFPAALFTAVPATAEAIATALRRLFLDVPRQARDLPRTRRAFMGYLAELTVPNPYSGTFEQAGPHELERHFNFSPAADPLTWGTAHADDPWPDTMPAVPAFVTINPSRERRAQLRGATARITRRTQFSRSHLGFEFHRPYGDTYYVWHLRYAPNPYPETIARYNAATGASWPTDLPADVIAAVIGFSFMEVEQVAPQTEDPDLGRALAAWNILAGLRHDELAVTEELRRWIAARSLDDDHRARIAQLCLDYGWRPLLDELALVQPPGALRDHLRRVLDDGIGEPTFNEMGEPEGLP